MKFVQWLAALSAALTLQAGLGRFWPQAHLFADVMLIPVVWYGVVGSQRSGMLTGCAAGLLQDAWFQIGAFGLNGFKKTLLGWAIGGLGSRFDLNRQGGRLLGGFLASLADSLMDIGLRRLLDQRQPFPGMWQIAAKAIVTGLLVAGVFGVIDSIQRRRRLRSLSY